jgi:hypothetical protein
VSTGVRLNLTQLEDQAFWPWAIIETLRHTGVRIEELLEVTHLALVSYTLPDTGEVVPLLQIVPSKTATERLLLISPELASVLATIVTRVRDHAGRVPLVSRYDPHERITGPPLPHLFQRSLGWRRESISTTTAQRFLNDTLAAPASPTPPDCRCDTPHTTSAELFATEAVTGGLPVHIAAKILGESPGKGRSERWIG